MWVTDVEVRLDPTTHPVGLLVDCGWCRRVNSRVESGCMVCIRVLRVLRDLQASAEWRAWMDALNEDPACKDALADWLEERGYATAGAALRAVAVEDCPECHGTGRVRDRWLTVWPHEGRPCEWGGCSRGKRWRHPPRPFPDLEGIERGQARASGAGRAGPPSSGRRGGPGAWRCPKRRRGRPRRTWRSGWWRWRSGRPAVSRCSRTSRKRGDPF